MKNYSRNSTTNPKKNSSRPIKHLISLHHQLLHKQHQKYHMSWREQQHLYYQYLENAVVRLTGCFVNQVKGVLTMVPTVHFQLIHSTWTKKNTTSSLSKSTTLNQNAQTIPFSQTTLELWNWEIFINYLKTISKEEHNHRMNPVNYPTYFQNYHHTNPMTMDNQSASSGLQDQKRSKKRVRWKIPVTESSELSMNDQ